MEIASNNQNSINQNCEKKKRILPEKTKKLLFFICIAAPFILQVLIFYVYVNFSNILQAFLEYENPSGVGYVSHFAGFKNFAYVLETLFAPENVGMFGVSLLMYVFTSCLATPVSIIFSFYVYKKYFLSEFFRVILFFPQIISTVIMSSLYSYMVGEIYMMLTGAESSLLSLSNEPITVVLTVIAYALWMGFGANILLASGAMSGINESVVESCHLDGCNTVQEFIFITLPSIFPTIITFIVVDLAAILTNQMHLYTFFGQNVTNSNMRSLGYYLYVQTVHSPGLSQNDSALYMTYPQISAMGVLMTLVVLPLTLTVRRLLEKFGPSEN